MDVLEVDPLDLGDMGGYSTQIVLDEFGTGLDSNGPSMNLAHDLPSAVSPTDLGCTGFGQPTIPLPVESYSTPGLMGLGSMFVGAQPAADFSPAQYPPTQQNQQYQLQQQTMQLSDRTQHRQGANRSRTAGSLGSSVPSQHTIPSRPNFDRYPTTPARLSVPSQPALMSQGTFQSYSPSSGSQRSLSDASYVFSDSGYQFQSPNSSPSSDAKVLAIVDRQPYGTSYQCSLSPFSGNSSCNRILSSRNHMLEHLAKEHADYNVYRTLRKVCQICNAFYSLSTAGFCSNCTLPGMNVQLQLAICGESSDFTSMVNDDTDPMTSSVVFSPQASFGSPAPGACWNSGVPPDQSNSGPYW